MNSQLKQCYGSKNPNTFKHLETLSEEIIAPNNLIDVFELTFEKFKCCKGFASYSNCLLKVHKSQICFNVKLNMHLYMHSFLVLMFIMFPILKLRNYMVAGQNQP